MPCTTIAVGSVTGTKAVPFQRAMKVPPAIHTSPAPEPHTLSSLVKVPLVSAAQPLLVRRATRPVAPTTHTSVGPEGPEVHTSVTCPKLAVGVSSAHEGSATFSAQLLGRGPGVTRRELLVVHSPHAVKAFAGGSWSRPFKDRKGTVLGCFALHSRSPRGPSASELALIAEASELLGMALEQRTTERENRLLHAAMESAAEAVVVADAGGRITFRSWALAQLVAEALRSRCLS